MRQYSINGWLACRRSASLDHTESWGNRLQHKSSSMNKYESIGPGDRLDRDWGAQCPSCGEQEQTNRYMDAQWICFRCVWVWQS